MVSAVKQLYVCMCYICIRVGSVHYFVLSRWSHCVVYIVEFCAMCFSLGYTFNSLCVLSQVLN